MSVCSRFSQYYETLGNSYMRERQKLIWDNRMIESRLAVAQQLQEMSRIMDMVAEDLYDISICGSSAYDGIAEDSQEASYCGEAGLGDG